MIILILPRRGALGPTRFVVRFAGAILAYRAYRAYRAFGQRIAGATNGRRRVTRRGCAGINPRLPRVIESYKCSIIPEAATYHFHSPVARSLCGITTDAQTMPTTSRTELFQRTPQTGTSQVGKH